VNVNESTGEMTRAAVDAGGLLASDQQRVIAEVQAAMVIAARFPRNAERAKAAIIEDCKRQSLAEVGLYSYGRGGSDISGLSIRAAEGMAQRWGNMQFGIRELEQRDGESIVQSYAWDLEVNTKREQTFTVPHVRDTRSGPKVLTDSRDIYEMTANMGARRLRACILAVIPGDIVDAALDELEKTLERVAAVTPDRVEKMLEYFGRFGVTQQQVEDVVQRKMEALTPKQMIKLIKISNSLKDGMSSPGDWFKGASKVVTMPRAKTAEPAATEAKPPAIEDPKIPAAGPRPAATPAASQPAQTNGGSAPASPASPQAPPTAPSVPAQSAEPAYHVTKVEQGKWSNGKVYFLITTKEGLVVHTRSTTVAGDAVEAKEDGRAVHLVGKTTTFTIAPLQIEKVIAAERMPGEEDARF
jgi:hypothetical protein